MFKVSRTLLLVAEGSCESLGFCSPWGEDRDKLLEGGGFGSSTGCSSPYSDCFTQRPCSLVPTAEEVMTRLVNTLTLSVENAQKWLMKTEVSLKEEGIGQEDNYENEAEDFVELRPRRHWQKRRKQRKF